MAKEKVYKLAQEFKVSSEALVQMLREMDIPVKSHMSTVDEELRDKIKEKFEQERAKIKKEYERKKQIMAKAREDIEEAAAVPAPAPQQPQQAAPAVGTGAQNRESQNIQRPQGGQQPAQPQNRQEGAGASQQQQRPRSPIRKYHERESWAKGTFTPSQQQSGGAGAGVGVGVGVAAEGTVNAVLYHLSPVYPTE